MTLYSMPFGEKCKIIEVKANPEVKKRLEMLNIYVGAEVCPITKSPLKKNILVLSGGLRVGLGKCTAENITVERIE